MCPRCDKKCFKKMGFFIRKKDGRSIQRYLCLFCQKSFSDQTRRIDYRMHRRRFVQPLFRLLCSGVSQRRAALIFACDKDTVARWVIRYGLMAEQELTSQLTATRLKCFMFDEMESFEHTKCKPLTMPIAVDPKTRHILALEVAPIAAKGPLARTAYKRYGPRTCGRKEALQNFFAKLKPQVDAHAKIYSDQSKHYPKPIKDFFPDAIHTAYKGRRGCVVGQGELKEGGYDPLFKLNHTYAMIRDNLKRLTRRTWCTTKKPSRLRYMLLTYAVYHNQLVRGITRPVIPLF